MFIIFLSMPWYKIYLILYIKITNISATFVSWQYLKIIYLVQYIFYNSIKYPKAFPLIPIYTNISLYHLKKQLNVGTFYSFPFSLAMICLFWNHQYLWSLHSIYIIFYGPIVVFRQNGNIGVKAEGMSHKIKTCLIFIWSLLNKVRRNSF